MLLQNGAGMWRNLKLWMVFAGAIIGCSGPAEARPDLIVKYDFFGDLGDEPSEPFSSKHPNVTAADLVRGPGIIATALGSEIFTDGFNSRAWSTSGLDPDDYYQFSITTQPNTLTSLNTLFFNERRIATGIRNFQLRTSTDGFATFANQGPEFTVPDNIFQRDQMIGLTGLSGIMGGTTVTFRLYGYNSEDPAGTWALFNHTQFGGLYLDGNSFVIPEPATSMILAVSLSGWSLFRRRRIRRVIDYGMACGKEPGCGVDSTPGKGMPTTGFDEFRLSPVFRR